MNSKLPAGWTEHHDSANRTYFYNKMTGETRWLWTRHLDPSSNREYMYNTLSGDKMYIDDKTKAAVSAGASAFGIANHNNHANTNNVQNDNQPYNTMYTNNTSINRNANATATPYSVSKSPGQAYASRGSTSGSAYNSNQQNTNQMQFNQYLSNNNAHAIPSQQFSNLSMNHNLPQNNHMPNNAALIQPQSQFMHQNMQNPAFPQQNAAAPQLNGGFPTTTPGQSQVGVHQSVTPSNIVSQQKAAAPTINAAAVVQQKSAVPAKESKHTASVQDSVVEQKTAHVKRKEANAAKDSALLIPPNGQRLFMNEVECVATNGRPYAFNKETGKSRWLPREKPVQTLSRIQATVILQSAYRRKKVMENNLLENLRKLDTAIKKIDGLIMPGCRFDLKEMESYASKISADSVVDSDIQKEMRTVSKDSINLGELVTQTMILIDGLSFTGSERFRLHRKKCLAHMESIGSRADTVRKQIEQVSSPTN
uniref:WW domain-containing protein n=1 Tax=Timspurckia oligopyrenoides TaxID=708627 RepID=A0A7S0ZFD6_9RHOD|mmetsp:Transcript_3113/g.5481  ORF Transcript_3113/g.5481 Transcript_3113/m.5481 type:complete len:480 (+) Transcript_3113:92-1531(+)